MARCELPTGVVSLYGSKHFVSCKNFFKKVKWFFRIFHYSHSVKTAYLGEKCNKMSKITKYGYFEKFPQGGIIIKYKYLSNDMTIVIVCRCRSLDTH